MEEIAKECYSRGIGGRGITITDASDKTATLFTPVKTPVKHRRGHEKFHSKSLTKLTRDGCLLWGRRVIIPPIFRQLLEELHSVHLGITRMKSLARSFVWWPQLDGDIEDISKSCTECHLTAINPPRAPAHPWLVSQQPWERIHVDHAQWDKWLLLVAINAFSEWPEVFVVNSTSAQQTIHKLRTVFTTHGLPVTLISDNGPPFTSSGFSRFMDSNGIIHRRVPPYHPSSNGLAKNFVKSVKQALNKSNIHLSVESKIAKFLATYRNTPHTTTGCTPSEVLLGRVPRTKRSLVHPCMSQRMSVAAEENLEARSPQTFNIGQRVALCDLHPTTSQKWRAAWITQRLGALTYELIVDGYKRQAYIDQLRPWPTNDEPNRDGNLPCDQSQPPVADLQTGNKPGIRNDCDQSPLVDDLVINEPHVLTEATPAVNTRPERNTTPPK